MVNKINVQLLKIIYKYHKILNIIKKKNNKIKMTINLQN